MDPLYVGIIGFVVVLVLMALGIPIAVSMAVPGILGLFYLMGLTPTFEVLVSQSFRYGASYEFSAIPLFVLMGFLATQSGLTTSAYDSARLWLARVPGGLSMTTCVASGLLGACSGSGVSATAALSRIAIPEMLRHNYDKGLAAGSVAASATIGSLIPPSILMVVYSVFTEVSLGRMLLAGYLPGMLSIAIYITMIGVRVRLNPNLAPLIRGESITWKQRIAALEGVWGIAVLFFVLLGGIYTGFFTATESAALAVAAAFLVMIINRRYEWSSVRVAFLESVEVVGMAYLMLVGAVVFVVFLGVSGLPRALATAVVSINMPLYLFLALSVVLYVFLGMFMSAIAMLMLTLPIFLPVLDTYGVNLIWFGIIFVKMSEVGAITPPVGMSCFIVKGVVKDEIPLSEIFRGIGWFVAMDLLIVAILIAFPQISLWLPNTFKGRG